MRRSLSRPARVIVLIAFRMRGKPMKRKDVGLLIMLYRKGMNTIDFIEYARLMEFSKYHRDIIIKQLRSKQ